MSMEKSPGEGDPSSKKIIPPQRALTQFVRRPPKVPVVLPHQDAIGGDASLEFLAYDRQRGFAVLRLGGSFFKSMKAGGTALAACVAVVSVMGSLTFDLWAPPLVSAIEWLLPKPAAAPAQPPIATPAQRPIVDTDPLSVAPAKRSRARTQKKTSYWPF